MRQIFKSNFICQVQPYGKYVLCSFVRDLMDVGEEIWLKDYWKRHHKTILPKQFKVAECKFQGSEKQYHYPFVKACLRVKFKLTLQFKWYRFKQGFKNKMQFIINLIESQVLWF